MEFLFLLIVFLLVLYLVISGIIFNIRWIIGYNHKPVQNKEVTKNKFKRWFVKQLLSYQNKGINTVPKILNRLAGYESLKDLIPEKFLASKTSKTQSEIQSIDKKYDHKPQIETPDSASKKTSYKPERSEREKENILEKLQISRANTMLVLGSGLVMLAVMVFVGFNWDNFSNLMKFILLAAFNITLFAVSYLSLRNKKILQASKALFSLSSIVTVFTFLGLWIWLINPYTLFISQTFYLYWSGVSLVLFFVYRFVASIFKNSSLEYLPLGAIYSFVIGVSFWITIDSSFRIVMIALMNLFVYQGQKYIGRLGKNSSLVIKVINQVLGVGIILVVAVNRDMIIDNSLYFVALMALMIPTIFNQLVFYKEKASLYLKIELIVIPLKILLFSSFFTLYPFNLMYILLGYTFVIMILRKLWYIEESIKQVMLIMNWVLRGLVTLGGLLIWFANYEITSLEHLCLFIVLPVLIILESVWNNNKNEVSAALLFLPLMHTALVDWFFDMSLNYLVVSSLIIYTILEIGNNILAKTSWNKVFIPLTFVYGAGSIMLSLGTHMHHIAWSLWIVTGFQLLRSQVSDKKWFSYIGVSLQVPALITTILSSGLEPSYTGKIIVSSLFGLNALIYALFQDLQWKDKILRYSYFYGFMVFSVFSVVAAGGVDWLILLVLGIIFTWLWYQNIYHKTFHTNILSYFVGLIWVINANNYWRFDEGKEMLLYSFLGIITAFFSTKLMNIFDKQNQQAFRVQASIISIISLLYILDNLGDWGIILILNVVIWIMPNILLGTMHKFWNYLAGFGAVIIPWWIALNQDYNAHWYVIPTVIYLLTISYFIQKNGNEREARAVEVIAYLLEFFTLLGFSTQSSTEGIINSLVLMILSVAVIMFGVYRKRRDIIVLASIFLVLAILIRFLIVLLVIPWYVYLLFTGIALIVWAIKTLNSRK